MNSKEALEKISWRYVNDTSFQEWCETIKQDLDRLEKFAHENASLHTEIDSLHTENAKLKKVIEILKKKQVSSIMLWNSIDVFDYNLYRQEIPQLQLNDEEYDLLKEYL